MYVINNTNMYMFNFHTFKGVAICADLNMLTELKNILSKFITPTIVAD